MVKMVVIIIRQYLAYEQNYDVLVGQSQVETCMILAAFHKCLLALVRGGVDVEVFHCTA